MNAADRLSERRRGQVGLRSGFAAGCTATTTLFRSGCGVDAGGPILRYLPRLAELRVVDLGGTAVWGSRAPVRPRHVTVVNLNDAGQGSPGVTTVNGDALRADELLRGEDFDLVFSTSLIEHLGGHGPRRRSAEVVASMAPGYLVQTPYHYFPVEPHWMFPGFQFLPGSARSISLRDGRSPIPTGGSPMPRRTRSCRRTAVCLGDAPILSGGRDRLGAP